MFVEFQIFLNKILLRKKNSSGFITSAGTANGLRLDIAVFIRNIFTYIIDDIFVSNGKIIRRKWKIVH